jgi:hypothetical protein
MTDVNLRKAPARKATNGRLPPVADYSDTVSDEQFERIKALVPEDDFKDAKLISGPAW